jgi:membrane protease YdiL (CAAX protease family)
VLLAIVVTGVSGFLAFSPARSGSLAFWALAVGPTVALALVAGIWGKREELLRDWLSPRWGDFSRGVVGAVVLFAVAWGVTHVLAPVGSPREFWLVSLYGQIGDPRVLQAQAPAVAVAVAVASFSEELLWRGLVTQLVADRVGSRTAWIVAAGLYAVAYVPTAWALGGASGLNPMLVVAAGGGGLFWGAMARFLGSLVPGILAHALFDWAVVMMFPLWGSLEHFRL